MTSLTIHSMNTLAFKNQYQSKKVNYEVNLKRMLGVEDLETRILRRSAGLLKGLLKKSSVSYQRGTRKEWERRVKKLEN